MKLVRRIALVAGLSSFLLPGPARAQTRAELCAAEKLVASAGYESCVLWAEANNAKKPDPGKRDDKIAGCAVRLERAWARAVRVYGADCPQADDKPAVQALLDQCAADTAGETVPPRFEDNGDGTITDTLTRLLWERKTGTPGGSPNPADPHDVNNAYTWSLGSPWDRDGTAFTEFLAALNTPPGLGGRTDWRLPTIEELGGPVNPIENGIVDRDAPGCGRPPYPNCLADPFLPSASGEHWSDTSYSEPWGALHASFRFRTTAHSSKAESRAVRAVAGGS